jgi:hypothetical protein
VPDQSRDDLRTGAGYDVAAVPDGQRITQMIAVGRFAHRAAIDSDRMVGSAEGLAWNGKDMLKPGTPLSG